ncbi:hypothetical protein [Neptunomonas japonica]|uniref:DUF2845 domain-containing protein n=1 Tax=Neptunomonas japonica JAMM 1380 TaxID=1441457 RepID=A0A7R6SVE9_9GAMM|nr:hypothetical protein [Neptunomonas japonica]BBB29350.1 conserved hypothetical protein [Neptunomonas japonica JAMM 1380]
MKKWTLILAIIFSFNANAGSLRADGGRVLINEGDSIDVLLANLGSPKSRVKKVVCVSRRSKNSPCKEWGTVETWFYRYDDLNWKINIMGERILKIKWSRF